MLKRHAVIWLCSFAFLPICAAQGQICYQPSAIPCGSGLHLSPASGPTALVTWDFDDPDDLGDDGGDGTYDLTLYNVPVASGGALGYAMGLNVASQQYTTMASDVASLDINGDVDLYLLSVFAGLSSGNYNPTLNKDDIGSNRQYHTQGRPGGYFRFTTASQNVTTTDTVSSNLRPAFLEGWRDADTNTGYANIDRGTPVSGAAMGNIADTDALVTIGAYDGGYASWATGTYDVAAVFNAVPADTEKDSMYASGLMTTYADLTATEKTGLVSWWEWNPDTGLMEDQHGSNNMTSVNSPSTVASLVWQPESGMGISLASASTQYASSAAAGLGLTGDMSISLWFFVEAESTQYMVSKYEATGGYLAGLYSSPLRGIFYARDSGGVIATATAAVPVSTTSTWHHYCASLDDGVTATLYIDGQAGTPVVPTGTMDSASVNLLVGRYSSTYFDGVLDDIRIYTSALTESDCQALYASGEGLFD